MILFASSVICMLDYMLYILYAIKQLIYNTIISYIYLKTIIVRFRLPKRLCSAKILNTHLQILGLRLNSSQEWQRLPAALLARPSTGFRWPGRRATEQQQQAELMRPRPDRTGFRWPGRRATEQQQQA
jgi:hypothetical protein